VTAETTDAADAAEVAGTGCWVVPEFSEDLGTPRRADLYVWGKSDPRFRPEIPKPARKTYTGRRLRRPDGTLGPAKPPGRAEEAAAELAAPLPADTTPGTAAPVSAPPAANLTDLAYCGGCDYPVGSRGCLFTCGPPELDSPGGLR